MNNRLLNSLTIKIFADGADLASIRKLYRDPRIQGFTTNPTLMRKAGVENYEAFAHDVLSLVPDRPVSFEVLADELEDMEQQALAGIVERPDPVAEPHLPEHAIIPVGRCTSL